MSRRKPTLTLFPYTTLFRSQAEMALQQAVAQSDVRAGFQAGSPIVAGAVTPDGRYAATGHADRLVRVWEDRKSTRLNSSHSQISYAVFCLKKKKVSDPLDID